MSSFVHNVKNFLNDSEIDCIKMQVHKMESFWKSFDQYKKYDIYKKYFQNKDKMQHVLGDAIYLLHEKGNEGSREEIDWNLRKLLLEEFDWVYERLFNVIKSTFNCSVVEFDSTLPIPGFHIFGKYQVENSKFTYHQDSGILDYYPYVDKNNIRSFVTLIQSPKSKAHLDIMINDICEKHYYEYGTLHFWHGMIPHRIGEFCLDENEFRITFQGHFYVDPNSEVVKVYF